MSVLHCYYSRRRKARGGRKDRGRRGDKEETPPKDPEPAAAAPAAAEKEAEPVVYVAAPIPKVNPWKKSVSPEPVSSEGAAKDGAPGPQGGETEPQTKEAAKRKEPRETRREREEKKAARREEREDKKVKKEEREEKKEEGKRTVKVLPPAPKSNPWKKIPAGEEKVTEPKVNIRW